MRRSERARTLIAVFSIAALLRCAALLTPWNVDVLFVDEGEYARYARNLVERGAYEAVWTEPPAYKAHRPPLFPAFLAVNYALAGEDFIRSAKIMNVVLGSLVPLLVFACIELLLPGAARRRVALAGALVAAAYPYLIFYGLLMLSELLYTLLALVTTYLLLKSARSPNARVFSILAGMAAGATALTRPSYALFPVFIILVDIGRRGFSRERLLLGALLLGVFVCTLTPWLVRNHSVLGRPVLATNGGEPFWWGHNSDSRGYLPVLEKSPAQIADWEFAGRAPDELERSRRFFERAFGYIEADPLEHVLIGLPKLAYLWNVETREIATLTHFERLPPLGPVADRIAAVALTLAFPLLALALLAALIFGPRIEHRWVLTGFIVYSSVICMIFFGSSRFHLPFVPQMIVCAAPILALKRSDFAKSGRLALFACLALAYLFAVSSFQISELPAGG